MCHKTWKPHESSKSSTWRKLTAIFYGLCSFLPILRNKSVFWFSNNQSAVHIAQFGSQKTYLQTIAVDIYSVCLLNGISVTPQWVPRSENVDADAVSKLIDYDDWYTADHLFPFLNRLWGPHTTDRFANDQNNKLPRLTSLFWTPGCEHVNAFSRDWAGENNWLVPPVYLISSTIRHLLTCSAVGTIVPYWPSAPFWPLVFRSPDLKQTFVKDFKLFEDLSGLLYLWKL